MNPNDPHHAARLARARQWSYGEMKPFRESRAEIIKQIVGKNYGDGGSRKSVPLPFLRLFQSVLVPRLAAYAPAAYITTIHDELKSVAWSMMQETNQTAEAINIEETFQAALRDALCGPAGVIKTGLAPHEEELVHEGMAHDYGSPFASHVSFNNWIVDMGATSYESALFEGNYYRLPFDEVANSPYFNKRARSRIKEGGPTQPSDVNQGPGDEMAAHISRSSMVGEDQEIEDTVLLCDIFLRRERLLVTFLGLPGEDMPLAIHEWDGPRGGLYETLMFEPVMDQVLGLAPLASLYDLHVFLNDMYRKIIRQTKRAKDLLVALGNANVDDLKALSKGDDGTAKMLRNTREMPFSWRIGGADPSVTATYLEAAQRFSQMAGGMETLGGLGIQAPTNGQEQLMHQSASLPIEYMQKRMGKFAKRVMHKIAEYKYRDPFAHYSAVRTVDGLPDIPGEVITLRPEERTAEFFKLNFDVDVYSMRSDSPESQLQGIERMLNIISPFMPLMMQQGMAIKVSGLLQQMGELLNVKDMKSFIQVSTPPPGEGQPTNMYQDSPKMPASTTHHYIRSGSPGPTSRGQAMAIQQMAMGAATGQSKGGVQPKQAASLYQGRAG